MTDGGLRGRRVLVALMDCGAADPPGPGAGGGATPGAVPGHQVGHDRVHCHRNSTVEPGGDPAETSSAPAQRIRPLPFGLSRTAEGRLQQLQGILPGKAFLTSIWNSAGYIMPAWDVEARDRAGGVGVPAAVGVGAVRVAVRVTVGVGGGRVVTVGLARWLDPDERQDRRRGTERLVGRPGTDARVVLVAPVAAERLLVDFVVGDVGVDVRRLGDRRGWVGPQLLREVTVRNFLLDGNPAATSVCTARCSS